MLNIALLPIAVLLIAFVIIVAFQPQTLSSPGTLSFRRPYP